MPHKKPHSTGLTNSRCLVSHSSPIVVTTVAANTDELVNFQKPSAVSLLSGLKPLREAAFIIFETETTSNEYTNVIHEMIIKSVTECHTKKQKPIISL